MVARITAKGSLAFGIRITITLPREWTKKFDKNANIRIYGESLGPNWGVGTGEEANKYTEVFSQEELNAEIEELRTVIAEAKAALVQTFDREIELPLD